MIGPEMNRPTVENVIAGQVTEPAVAMALGYDYVDPILALESR